MSEPFTEDLELDARLLHASLAGGVKGYMAAALQLGISSTGEAMRRSEWVSDLARLEYRIRVATKYNELRDGGKL
jgi:hypothetical protein